MTINNDHKCYMKKTMDVAINSYPVENTPFAAIIVLDSKILIATPNQEKSTGDPTCHAEINAIRKATKILNKSLLEGAILYTTCEPCPMCFIAAYLAKIRTIVYGIRVEDLTQYGWEVNITAEEINKRSGSKIEIIPNVFRNECLKLFNLKYKGGFK